MIFKGLAHINGTRDLMKPKNIHELNTSTGAVFLDIGAGGASKKPSFISLDIADSQGVDIVGDAMENLAAIDSDRVDGIYSRHFLEHVDDVPGMVKEMVRVCKHGAAIEIIVPHFSNPFFYSDVTHQRHFGLYSFSYMARSEAGFRRSVPTYAQIPGLIQKSVHLQFKSYKPRFVRKAFKRLHQAVFNASTYMKEIYEELFCWLFPCYEIRYMLIVDKSDPAFASRR